MPPCYKRLCRSRLASLPEGCAAHSKSPSTSIRFQIPCGLLHPRQAGSLCFRSIRHGHRQTRRLHSEPSRFQFTEHRFRLCRSFGFPAVLRSIRAPSASEDCFRCSLRVSNRSEEPSSSRWYRPTPTRLSPHRGHPIRKV